MVNRRFQWLVMLWLIGCTGAGNANQNQGAWDKTGGTDTGPISSDQMNVGSDSAGGAGTDQSSGTDQLSGTDGAGGTDSSLDMGCIPLAVEVVLDRSQDSVSLAKAQITRLEELVELAKEHGLDPYKEEMTINTAQIFLEFADWDETHVAENQAHFELVANFKPDAAQLSIDLPAFERNEVVKMLDDALGTLQQMFSCEIVRPKIPRVDWTRAHVVGNRIEDNGQPVFLADYTWKPDAARLQQFHGQKDGYYLAPNKVVAEDGTMNSWLVTELADKPSGSIGNIFLGDGLPQWIKDKDPAITDGARHFTSYDIDNPNLRDLLQLMFKGAVPLMAGKRYTDLGYMVANEPSWPIIDGGWNSGPLSSYAMAKFKTWLAARYGEIAVLNKAWNTMYADFDEVDLAPPIDGALRGTPRFYDWAAFNMDRVTEFFTFVRDQIKRYDPEGKMTIKLMPWLWTESGRDHGIDMEALTRISGVSGCDASARNSNIWGNTESWAADYAFYWQELAMIYDFFRSVAPEHIIYDSETHFLSTVKFRDLYLDPAYARATYWLGHLHGLNATQSWVWGRNQDGSIKDNVGEGHAGSLVQQPRIVNEVAATYMDLNSFSTEITAMAELRKPIRLFYSKASAINDAGYMAGIRSLYESLYFEGIPLGFVTPDILTRQDDSNWDVVVVHGATTVTAQAVSALQTYLDHGGTVIMDSTSFTQNEIGQNMEPGLVASSGILRRVDGVEQMARQALDELAGDGTVPLFTVSETNSGSRKGCMWRAVMDPNGHPVISVVNLGNGVATVTITPTGKAAGWGLRDLLSGQNTPSTLTIAPMGVRLLVAL